MSVTIVFGCTGLVGSNILSTLLSSPAATDGTTTIQTISRRAPKSSSPALQAVVEPDTSLWTAKLASLQPTPTAVYSGLGTTRAAAGGIANQWKIDHDLNVEVAKAAKEAGVKTFVFISSTGCRGPLSGPLPYAQMKRGVEDTIQALGFDQAIILRPGMIVGEREQPHQGAAVIFGVLGLVNKVFGRGGRDRLAQDAEVIARAAVNAERLAREGKAPGKWWVLEQSDIVKLGRDEWKD